MIAVALSQRMGSRGGLMQHNFWTEKADALAAAYSRNAGTIRFELVTRALLMHLPGPAQKVIDIGGGFGQQAIMLARAGHSVLVLDKDPAMLAMAAEASASEPAEVGARISFMQGDGQDAVRLAGQDFDLACCHSVLMYQADPAPMLQALVDAVRPGGLVSILSLNRDAAAMRSGLQGRWRETLASLEMGRDMDGRYAPSLELARSEISAMLEERGACCKQWYGVGVFTDHLSGILEVDDLEEVILAEWHAGRRDPYRQVARCFHLVAERLDGVQTQKRGHDCS